MLKMAGLLALTVFLCATSSTPVTYAQEPASNPPKVAPLLPRDQEIALAESAAPPAIAKNAAVYVLEEKGYAKVRDGSNGFTCLVERDLPLNIEPICYDEEGSSTLL